MSTGRQCILSFALAGLTAVLSPAQSIAPAHSGTVHYFEGDVTVDGVKLVSQVSRFSEIREQSVLSTGLGRAEILLTPGVVLRVAENTSVRMLDNRLMSTRVELLSGTAMVESDDADSSIKDPAVTIVYKDYQVQPMRSGLFEITSDSDQVKVFKGEAKVLGYDSPVNVKEGNLLDLAPGTTVAKFDVKEGDDLYLWSRDRSAYLSAGNMASAQTLASSGYGNTLGYGYGNTLGYGYGTGLGYAGGAYGGGYALSGWNAAMWNGFSGGWYYNPYLNMYSFLPFGGTMYGPFGFGYFNPVTIAYVYNNAGYNWSGGGGARTGTTVGIQLPTAAPGGSVNRPTLPRLGTTASFRSTLTTPAPGTRPVSTLRPGGITSTTTSVTGTSSLASTAVSAAPVMSSPVRSAAPRGAAAPRR